VRATGEETQFLARERQAMSQDASFAELMGRVRAGDEQAAEDVVRRYEAAIRLEVRMRLGDPRLRRVFDSMDICQSVLASFFLRAAAGQYDLNEPSQLLKLLVAMTRNKVAFQARKQRARRRDHRRQEAFDQDALGAAAVSRSTPGLSDWRSAPSNGRGAGWLSPCYWRPWCW
jgi:DNA-directed RNA polymerase specialized sigma24 family protein